jgi:hypothetical protein
MLGQIRSLVENGRYAVGRHALLHMMEEGFEKEHCVGAVLGGRLLESYPAQNRYLIAGRFHLSAKNLCPLHVVCELTTDSGALEYMEQFAAPPSNKNQSDKQLTALPGRQIAPVVCFVTAYIPRPPEWISPHVRAAHR